MKKAVLAVLFVAATLSASISSAQCPIIVKTSFLIKTDLNNPCQRQVSFDFIGQSNGLSSINLTVRVGNSVALNVCIDASHAMNVQKNFTSAVFNACDLATIGVSITPYTTGNCGGSQCSATLSSTGGAPLPVKFSAFSASRIKDQVNLKWETATEINNAGFAIERNDNGNWQQVGFVASKAPMGNSSDKLSYEFNDMNYNKTMTQYRLKQVDIDGKAEYSDIKIIRGTSQDARTVLFPNPSSNGTVNLVFDGSAIRDIAVIDMAGQIVKQYRGLNSNSLQVTGLNTGMFSVRIMNRETGTISTEKFIVTAR
ncbi:MAG: T9SS type A sorting domain-containing protein [Chitinophagaceae bacterium]